MHFSVSPFSPYRKCSSYHSTHSTNAHLRKCFALPRCSFDSHARNKKRHSTASKLAYPVFLISVAFVLFVHVSELSCLVGCYAHTLLNFRVCTYASIENLELYAYVAFYKGNVHTLQYFFKVYTYVAMKSHRLYACASISFLLLLSVFFSCHVHCKYIGICINQIFFKQLLQKELNHCIATD